MDSGRTGPNDDRRQSDLAFGFDVEKDDRFRMGCVIVLSHREAETAIQHALATGFKRANPNWPNWSDRDRKEAVQYWLMNLMTENLA